MASVQVLPLGNYANGSRLLGPVEIADNVMSVDIALARCTTATPTIWPNLSTVVDLIPEVSVDGGATWVEAGAARGCTGGILLDRFGNELTRSMCGGSLPAPRNGIPRQYQVTTVVTGGPIRTSGTVEVN